MCTFQEKLVRFAYTITNGQEEEEGKVARTLPEVTKKGYRRINIEANRDEVSLRRISADTAVQSAINFCENRP